MGNQGSCFFRACLQHARGCLTMSIGCPACIPLFCPVGDPKAHRGLTYYRNESAAVGRPGLPVVVTETGRREDDRGIGDAQQANWTSLAYEKVWLPDAQVVG